MFVRRLAALAAFAVLLPTHVALAQSQTASTSSGLIRQNLASNTIAAVNLDEEAQGGGSGAARKYIPRVFAGLWHCCGSNGFTVGAGASLHPFTDSRHEIQGNAAYNRVEGSNGFGIDVDYLFNFTKNQVGRFTPYAGGGINVTHFGNGDCGDAEDILGINLDCSNTATNLQLGGGIKEPLKSGKEFFVEVYFVLDSDTTTILRAGLGW